MIERSKFDRYLTVHERRDFVSLYIASAIRVPHTCHVHDCRDPKDNKLLSLALPGRADSFITGDVDLLALHPWRNIPILTPTDFLAQSPLAGSVPPHP